MNTAITVTADIALVQPQAQLVRPTFELIASNQAHLNTWLTWPNKMQSALNVAAFFDRANLSAAAKQSLVLLVLYQQQVCGVISFNEFQTNNHSASVGYWLGEAYQGLGIVGLALAKLLDIGFNDYQLNKIVIRTGVGNVRSEAVARRLGFVFEGIARDNEWLNGRYTDHKVFSLLRREWLQQSL